MKKLLLLLTVLIAAFALVGCGGGGSSSGGGSDPDPGPTPVPSSGNRKLVKNDEFHFKNDSQDYYLKYEGKAGAVTTEEGTVIVGKILHFYEDGYEKDYEIWNDSYDNQRIYAYRNNNKKWVYARVFPETTVKVGTTWDFNGKLTAKCYKISSEKWTTGTVDKYYIYILSGGSNVADFSYIPAFGMLGDDFSMDSHLYSVTYTKSKKLESVIESFDSNDVVGNNSDLPDYLKSKFQKIK